MGTVRTIIAAVAFAIFASGAAYAAEDTLDPNKRRLGNDVLDIMESTDTGGESKAARIIKRAAEIFTDIVVPEEPEPEAKKKKHQGHGPPDWAPAHGYRRNFGEKETHDLGGFTRAKIEEGLSGAALIAAVRGEIERVVSGAPKDDVRGNAKPVGNDHPGRNPDGAEKNKSGISKNGGKPK